MQEIYSGPHLERLKVWESVREGSAGSVGDVELLRRNATGLVVLIMI